MKKTLFLIFALLLAIAVKAQDFKSLYHFDKINNTLTLDMTQISLFEQRVHLIYLLNNDNRFIVSISEDDGVFVIKRNPDSYDFNLESTFNDFYSKETAAFNSMSKDEIGESYSEWKSSLPNGFMSSMMMEVYVRDRQNNMCATADPFCTDNGMYQFPAGVNAGSGESGPNYNCLTTRPNPAWYYMRMSNSGGMTIYMYSTPSEDIDFCCWGPFDDPVTPCPNGLTGAKVVSCSYSPNPTENCQIPNNAQSGQYYILVITNFSNHPCNINFSKTAGSGTTDCSILEPFLTASSPCVGSTLVLEANVIEGAQYNWTGPDNQTHNGRTWTRNNATLNMAGVYSCHVVAGAQSGTETINVFVLPNVTSVNFTNTEAVAGQAMQFTGTEATNPAGHNSEITVRSWNFGDGGTGTGANPSHTYANPGDYQVTYTVAITGGNDGECSNSKTKTVQVRNEFNATVTSDGTSFCDGDATPNLTATASGGYGDYTYSWTSTPSCLIDYPNSANTTAHPAVGNTTFTCTISDGHSTLTKSVTVTVNAIPDVTITGPNPPHVNYNASTTLSVPQLSGATYEWSSEPANLIQSGQGTNQITTKNLVEPTTFYVTVSKNGCSDSNSITLAVGDALFGNVVVVGQAELCSGETTSLMVNPSGGTEQYSYNWQPANMIEGSNNTQTITTKALTSSLSYTCTITDTDNHTYTATSPTVIVNPIPEATAYIEEGGVTYKTYNILAGHHVILNMNNIPGATYSWEPAELIHSLNGATAQTYPLTVGTVEFTATVTTSSGCSNQDNVTVIVHPSLDNSSIASSDYVTCEDLAVTLTANPDGGTGDYSYYWVPNTGGVYSNAYTQTTTVYPNSSNHSYRCIIVDNGIDDTENNWIEKSINIGIHEKPSVNSTLIGQDYVLPGIDYMPYIYEYNIRVSSLQGYGILEGNYTTTWEIFSYYETPNHIPGTDAESTWQVYPDEIDKNKAYVAVDEHGNGLLQCTITTECGSTTSTRFIYTEGYNQGESIDEINYDKMVSVFPNPSNGEVYIGFNEQIVSEDIVISIYNYNGMLIDQLKGNSDTNVTHYSMKDMSNGLYIIKITGNDFVVTKKFVLNK